MSSSQIQNQQANNADTNNSQNVSGKSKGKQKKKGEKLDVDLFFANTTTNWASIMEDDSENDIIPPSQYNLPDAPKALVNEIDPSQLPSVPPFKIHLRNLHYDLEKEDLEGLFKNLTVVDIQMIKDRTIRTAWVEFETKQDLIQALDLNNRAVRGRNISMSLDRGGSDRYGSGDRRGRSGFGGRDNTSSDWRLRDTMPPKQVPKTGGYGGNRGPRRYGDDDGGYAPPPSHRNDYSGGRSGGYDDRGDDRSGYDDRYGRRNDYGHRRGNDSSGGMGGGDGGNWRRNDKPQEEPSNWRREVPSIPHQQQQDHSSYDQPRGGRSLRYDDNNVSSRAMLPPRMASDQQQQSSYRNDDTSGYNDDLYSTPLPTRTSNQSIDHHTDMQQPSSRALRNESSAAYDQRRSINEQYYQSNDQSRSGHRNPPLMDHQPRERLSSTRSNVSNVEPHSTDDYNSSGGGAGGSAPSTAAAPKERRKFVDTSVLDALRKQATETVQPARGSSYSSIFGEAKPVDTTEKELEIEKKLLSSKQAAIAATTAANEESDKSTDQQESTNDVGGDVSAPAATAAISVSSNNTASNDRPNRIDHREYQHRDHRSNDQDSIPPRRRANGGIGSNRMGGVGGGGGMRRDYDDRNNGALGDRRMGGGMRGPRGDHDRDRMGNNAPRMRRDGPRGDSYINNSSGGGGYNDRRRFGDRDRIGGRRGYGDDNVAPRYQDRGPRGGGGGGYDNDRNRYHSSGSDYHEWSNDRDLDSKQISYASTNKFEHLGETDDHGSE
ncbi:Eukaryotic translation initiation factor 4B [Dermatophagoides farinae]|uniref:Eukaryotic translation initiation factor 4B n=1 Tax=Dermatophagoides farinae TaxID=6954 RepID=A0A922KTC3_DERFA|nr:Eukaryotic translation initiation factor 4B [Dermatophagoides farinae]